MRSETRDWIISADELQEPRLVSELADWLERCSERFSSLPDEQAQQVRLQGLGAKKYFGEAKPIARFCIEFFRESDLVTVRHHLGNQPYDATIDDRRDPGGPIRYIEVSEGVDGYANALRMELLNQQGHAPAYGPISAEGARHNRGVIVADTQAHSKRALQDQELARLSEAAEKKSIRDYPDGTALVIVIDDFVPFSDDEDVAVLDDYIRQTVLPVTTQFPVLAVVGHRRLCRIYFRD